MMLEQLRNFVPFKIDALGIVTILGQKELDLRIGALLTTSYLDALPTLAPYLVAGGYITDPVPGFYLYNVTDGIMATDISAWFGRWLLVQNITWNSSRLHITERTDTLGLRHILKGAMLSLILPFLLIGILLTMAVLSHDLWAIVNVVAMFGSGFLRWSIITQLRTSLSLNSKRPAYMNAAVKVFCVTPSGKGITIDATRAIVINGLLTNPTPVSPVQYRLSQAIVWLCFATHIICLGMSALANQVAAIVLLCLVSVLFVACVGVKNSSIGRYNLALEHCLCATDSRTEAYIRLKLSVEEEDGLVDWSLAPQRRNVAWWQNYHRLKASSSPQDNNMTA